MKSNSCLLQPYLFFDGRCDEAIEFYRRAVGAETLFLMRFKDSPEPPESGSCGPLPADKVMHASLRIGETTFMASDGRCTGKPNFQGFSLSLTVPTETEAEKLFTALAEGGQVQMPLVKTFFSPRFGMIVDRFGVTWMILVATALAAERPFVITHTFDAPRARVWKAWTDREQLMQWFGPKGFTMTTATLDFRAGGIFHYCLRAPDGRPMWGKFVYREIVAPERIVLVNSFSDEAGGLTRHPMSPTWPLEMITTTTFAEEGDKTRLTIEWTPLNPSDEERETFDSMHEGMKQGWTGTFEQLSDYLVKH